MGKTKQKPDGAEIQEGNLAARLNTNPNPCMHFSWSAAAKQKGNI